MTQGDIWWADIPAPTGSGPDFCRPVPVVQGDTLNQSTGATKTTLATVHLPVQQAGAPATLLRKLHGP